jgi:hypothetical protein
MAEMRTCSSNVKKGGAGITAVLAGPPALLQNVNCERRNQMSIQCMRELKANCGPM